MTTSADQLAEQTFDVWVADVATLNAVMKEISPHQGRALGGTPALVRVRHRHGSIATVDRVRRRRCVEVSVLERLEVDGPAAHDGSISHCRQAPKEVELACAYGPRRPELARRACTVVPALRREGRVPCGATGSTRDACATW